MVATPYENDRVRRLVLLHLLEHHGHQVRFEASQWATEFGILRRFPHEDPGELRNTLRALEMARMIYQRTQYVVGYSEPKSVYSLTTSGHRQALEYRGPQGDAPPGEPLGGSEADDDGPEERPAAPTGSAS